MKIRGMEVYQKSNQGNYAVCYAAFDLGMKWKLYNKVVDNSGDFAGWKYVNAFESITQAVKYMNMTADLPAYSIF